MPDVAATRQKVQQVLTEMFGRVEVDQAGDFSFAYHSTRVFVRIAPWAETSSVVNVYAIVNDHVPASPELYHYVATQADGWVFGHVGAKDADDGTVTVVFRYTLLGDFLDPEELRRAVGAVATTADEIDDQIRAQFGGRRFQDVEAEDAAAPEASQSAQPDQPPPVPAAAPTTDEPSDPSELPDPPTDPPVQRDLPPPPDEPEAPPSERDEPGYL